MRTKARTLNERGSGTVLALGLMAMLVALFAILQLPLRDTVTASNAQVAADQAALAAADSLRGLATGIPCEIASLVVAQSNYTNSTCSVVGNSVYVSVRPTPFIVAEARAGI
jgi:secretion/DNA translocation related TadE-like protein